MRLLVRFRGRKVLGQGANSVLKYAECCIIVSEISLKPIIWMGASLEAVRKFPSLARQRAGFQLGRVQQGLEPRDWKPLPSVGAGVKEIRIHTENEYRVFYTAAFQNNVYVLHAFDKKTRR